MLKRLNKKGQDLSIGTLILIVLGIIVLVLLILGFSMGWDNLWRKIGIYRGGSSLADVATACNLAGNSNDRYKYCQDFVKIKGDSGLDEYLNCEDERLQSSIDKKLDCQNQNYALEKAYCQKLKENLKEKYDEQIKVNNKNCGGSEYGITKSGNSPSSS